jgi:hypothetical protein
VSQTPPNDPELSKKEVSEFFKHLHKVQAAQQNQPNKEAGPRGMRLSDVEQAAKEIPGVDPQTVALACQSYLAEQNKKKADQERRSKTIRLVFQRGIATSFIAVALFFAMPWIAGTFSAWFKPAAPEAVTILGKWRHPSGNLMMEFFPDGKVLVNGGSGTASGAYSTGSDQKVALSLPGVTGEVLSLSKHQLRIHFSRMENVWWWKEKVESDITYQRPFQASSWIFLACGLVGLVCAVFGFGAADSVAWEGSSGQGMGCMGVLLVVIGCSLLNSMGWEWLGMLCNSAAIGSCVGAMFGRAKYNST